MTAQTADRRPHTVFLGVLCAVCCVLLSGCVTRTLTIKSEPPGALVYMNDKLKGTTPLTYDPEWYGGYRVMLRKDGYERFEERRVLRAPAYLWVPLDLVMEAAPWTVRDAQEWSFTLTPLTQFAEPVPPEVGPSRAERIAAEKAANAAQAALPEEPHVDGP